MHIFFGLSLDQDALPAHTGPALGHWRVGPRRLLRLLEEQLGLTYPAGEISFLRVEQYRQALLTYTSARPEAFFAVSLQADPLATAEVLLARRDELREAGWDFSLVPGMPPRLAAFAGVEQALHPPDGGERLLLPGFADRWQDVVEAIAAGGRHGVETFHCAEPEVQLSPGIRQLLKALAGAGARVLAMPQPDPPAADTDLARWQRSLRAEGGSVGRQTLAADGSLLVLRARRDTHLAAFAAAWLRLNPDFQPALLQADNTLDDALYLEGLPSLGLPSASLARPTLQVLKLVTVFLWEPVDVYKVMEFVSLAVKPLDDGLARRIAVLLAQTPGLFSDAWYAVVNGYFDELAGRGISDEPVRRQYEFWFRRHREDVAAGQIDKGQAREIYEYLFLWAKSSYDSNVPMSQSLLTLAAQARRIVELLDALPEQRLTYLELERIVRTIYEPAPVNPREPARGRLPNAAAPGAVIGPVDELLWWNFTQAEPDYFFSRWYPPELRYLNDLGVYPELPADLNNRLAWRRKRPVLWSRRRLVLCLPQSVAGESMEAHPLFGDLEAAFGDLSAITYDVDAFAGGSAWVALRLPQAGPTPARPLGRPEPFLRIRPPALREAETPTSLMALLYYPHQWVFRHHIKLRASGILSVVDGNALLGNLAHRFIEEMFAQNWQQWNKADLERWMDEQAPVLLRKEGASLLMYGREPERVAFVKRMKNAAWSLMRLLLDNRWSVAGAEEDLDGVFDGVTLRGRADLLLERPDGERAIVDMKWSGAGRYQELLRNQEDLQLALYAYLAAEEGRLPLPHTAYFIIDRGQVLARNEKAFREARPPAPDLDHQAVYRAMYERISATLRWRISQLSEGEIEIRCEQTQQALEAHYGETLLEMLEMKRQTDNRDDYRTLIQIFI